MTSSDEDKTMIKSLHLSKGYDASRLLAEFPDKGWTKRSINRLFQKLTETGTAVPDVSQLKQRLIDTWSSLSQDVIDDAIDQWTGECDYVISDVILSTCCSKPALQSHLTE